MHRPPLIPMKASLRAPRRQEVENARARIAQGIVAREGGWSGEVRGFVRRRRGRERVGDGERIAVELEEVAPFDVFAQAEGCDQGLRGGGLGARGRGVVGGGEGRNGGVDGGHVD